MTVELTQQLLGVALADGCQQSGGFFFHLFIASSAHNGSAMVQTPWATM
jgi:hypothetical protein